MVEYENSTLLEVCINKVCEIPKKTLRRINNRIKKAFKDRRKGIIVMNACIYERWRISRYTSYWGRNMNIDLMRGTPLIDINICMAHTWHLELVDNFVPFLKCVILIN